MPSFQAPGRSATARSPAISAALEPVAQDDVQRIGHLVGVDADEAALDAAVEADEVVGREGRDRRRSVRRELAGRGSG